MRQSRFNCFFVGCVDTSATALSALLVNPLVFMKGVLTLKTSRFNADFADIAVIAKRYNVPVYYAEDLIEKTFADLLSEGEIDLMFVIGWSKLIPSQIVHMPRLGTIGFHPADLPMNRGRHPLTWALVLDLDFTASTLFLLDEGVDSGPILSKEMVKIEQNDDAGTLYQKIINILPKQIDYVIRGISDGSLQPIKQDHSKANYWRKRSINDGRVDWRMSASSIHNLVRGLTRPYVGADFLFKGKIIKLWKTKIVLSKGKTNLEPGKVLKNQFGYPIVCTGSDFLQLLEFEPLMEIKQGEYL